MKSNRLLSLSIACAVLAGLAGTLYWSNQHPRSTPPAEAASTGPTILKVNPASVTAFTIRTKYGPTVSLARDAHQAWQITAPKPMHADPQQVSMLLSSLSPLTAQEVIANDAADLKQYGLDSPAVEVGLTEKNHSEQRLLLGDNTPVGSAVYAMVAGDRRVFATSTAARDSLNKTANDLRDRRLVTFAPEQIGQIEVTRNGATFVLAHTGGTWALEKPAAYRTDATAADGLATAIADAEMESSQPGEREAQADFANGTPVATVKVTGPGGTEALEVRKGNTSDFVKSSVVPGVYRVDLSLGDSLSRSVDDYRNKQLFDFSDAEPDGVQLEIAQPRETSVDLVHNAQGWWRDGKKIQGNSVDSLISGLRDLTATGFASTGFSKPVLTASVTSNGGKRVEKVEVAKVASGKSGARYLARRSGDPSLYVLDGGAVEGIESAAAGIQPAH